MKRKTVIVLAGAVLLGVVLTSCSAYRHVERADGTSKTTVTLAPGTTVTTQNGGCINSAGGTCEQQPTQQVAQ